MKFSRSEATIAVPDGTPEGPALERITHLAIGAHQDDCEIMAVHGILACFQRDDQWFGAVTCTDGAGSPRRGEYASYSDQEMACLRRSEQDKAAIIGNYAAVIQLNHPSAAVKDPHNPALGKDLAAVLDACRPKIVYTHNPADKHETHLAVTMAAIRALRELPAERRPEKVYGCEVWRNLDWLADRERVALDVSGHENIAEALIGVYDSQISGGKRYDTATLGRRRANATYLDSHSTDLAEAYWFAMDLTPLVRDDKRDILEFVLGHVEAFRRDVEARIRRHTP
jgi:LmbE family N-acetylglucosaminyl deacetylase